MITIDQLLESVDLEFKPRWITQDKDGTVCIWPLKPERMKLWWYVSCEYGVYTCLKLSEFDGKDWTECIYEVPRKTTGKIERFSLEDFVCITDIENYVRNVLDAKAFDKLNALVDAVNEHADIIRQIGQWGSSKGECLWCEKITKFEPGALKGAKNE